MLFNLLFWMNLEMNSPQHKNRLAHEKSPYLLQHAGNPVDWFPWGEEAFQKAKKENKPIFLSIGYSTCHWCHVMEKESFENADLAAILNEHFVSIKVDREERPDLDRVYMAFVQASTGSGGWPMSVWLTPELKPFYGGTYFPPESKWGRPGFREVLLKAAEIWEKDRQSVLQSGQQITEALRQHLETRSGETGSLNEKSMQLGFRQFQSSYDSKLGGFGAAPKFPRPAVFAFLLRHYANQGDKQALEMTLHTLREMGKGGIYDQLGGGFHRYSTDERWHVPHFEKMLYDQAQLITSYLEAFQISKDPAFEVILRESCDYVLRELTSPEGGFYSAQDADSAADPKKPEEKTEGAFYIWEKSEIEKILGTEAAQLFFFRYGISESGNTLNDPHGEFVGKNILFQSQSLDATAATFKKTKELVQTTLNESRASLLALRAKRPLPHLDDKVLTSWNGLMISALAKTGAVLEETRYLKAAEKAAHFVLKKMRDSKTDRLLRRYRDGVAGIFAFGDDYAFFIAGLLDLYESTLDANWVLEAEKLAVEQAKYLWDEKQGGFWDAADDDKSVLIRSKENYDGAEPSPNSIAAQNCLRLAQLIDSKLWQERGEKTLLANAGNLERMPHAMPQMLTSLYFYLGKHQQIVIAGKRGSPDTEKMLRVVRNHFLPNTVLILADGGESQKILSRSLSFLSELKPIENKATAYVCENYSCKSPTNQIEEFKKILLEQTTPSR